MSDYHDDEVPRDLAKLWTWAKEAVAHVEGEIARILDALFGRDGTNGINGRTKALETRVGVVEVDLREARAWGERVWEIERHKPGQCIGKVALDDYIATQKKATDELHKARTALYVAVIAALIPAIASVYVARSSQATQLELARITQRMQTQEAERYPVPGAFKSAEQIRAEEDAE